MKISKVLVPTDFADPYWQDNFKDFRTYILYKLGWPGVRIELQDEQLNVAIADAVRKFMKYGTGQYDINFETATVTSDGYAPLPANLPDPKMIKDVIFLSRSLDTGMATDILGENAAFGFVDGMNDFYSVSDYTFDLVKYVLWRRNLEDANDILGLAKSWDIIDGQIKVFPTRSFILDNQIGILYGRIPTPDEITTEDWIQDYAYESAKHILGTVRGKFSGFAAPGGQATTDGSDLKTESSEKMKELIEELKLNRPSPKMMQL